MSLAMVGYDLGPLMDEHLKQDPGLDGIQLIRTFKKTEVPVWRKSLLDLVEQSGIEVIEEIQKGEISVLFLRADDVFFEKLMKFSHLVVFPIAEEELEGEIQRVHNAHPSGINYATETEYAYN